MGDNVALMLTDPTGYIEPLMLTDTGDNVALITGTGDSEPLIRYWGQ